MKAIFLAPIRVIPAHWSAWTRLVAQVHQRGDAKETLAPVWHVVYGTEHLYHKVTDLGPLHENAAPREDFARPLDGLFAALGRVRRNAFASQMLSDERALFIFDSADILLVEVVDLPCDYMGALREIEAHRKVFEAGPRGIEPRLNDLIDRANKRARTEAQPEISVGFDLKETIAHCVLLGDRDDAIFQKVVAQCFRVGGLPYDPEDAKLFEPGWSFSVIKQNALDTTSWEIVALMGRLQCEWFTTRINRDFCLRSFGEIDTTQSVIELVDTESQLVAQQRQFRLWRHRMRDYRANLKPGLTRYADRVEANWKVQSDMKYVDETLSQAREFIQNAYSGGMLKEEREQSGMLLLISSVGVLGMAGALGGVWSWIERADLAEDVVFTTPLGQRFVFIILVLNGLIALGFFGRSAWLRLRRSSFRARLTKAWRWIRRAVSK